jgi:DNA-binding NarL/FixJ family response regulator
MNGSAQRKDLLVVDDHPLVRQALASTLQAADSTWHVALAGSSAQARHLLSFALPFAAVLCDQRLPDGEGLKLLGEVQGLLPTARKVLLSGGDDLRLATLARQQGLDGYLSKSLEPHAMVTAMRQVLAGERVFPSRGQHPEISLTERQLQVLSRVGAGRSSKEIARDLGIAERTIKDHLTLIYLRLGVSNRAEAVSRAGALGLIPLG